MNSFDLAKVSNIRRWMDHFDGEISLVSYASENVEIHQAVTISMMLWPTFCKIDGCFIWQRSNEEEKLVSNVGTWMEQRNGDRSAVESIVNHLHLWDVFDSQGEDGAEEAIEWMASIFEKSWTCALKDQYPDVSFEVTRTGAENDYGPTITAHALR